MMRLRTTYLETKEAYSKKDISTDTTQTLKDKGEEHGSICDEDGNAR